MDDPQEYDRFKLIKDAIEEADDNLSAFYLKTLAKFGYRHQIHFDVEYGLNRRTGYSMSIEGKVYSELEPTLRSATKKAIEKFLYTQADYLAWQEEAKNGT
jgi:hypothetical protein